MPSPVVYTDSAIEPFTVADVKDYLRVTGDDDNAYIRDLIETARRKVETDTQRTLIEKTLKLYFNSFPAEREIRLPAPPVISVTSITYKDEDGAGQTLPVSDYSVDSAKSPGRVVLANDAYWPTTDRSVNNVVVTYKVGFGTTAAAVPREIKQAMLFLVGHWYANRESVSVVNTYEVPQTVDYLLLPWRVYL